MIDFLKALCLVIAANATPVLGFDLLKQYGARPLDGGRTWFDRRRVFGDSKTVRGLALSVAASAVLGPLLGISVSLAALAALAAMAGDLLSSFIKRRLHQASGAAMIGLDQIPESLFPLLVLRRAFLLSSAEILAGVLVFMIIELSVSRIAYGLRMRKRPH